MPDAAPDLFAREKPVETVSQLTRRIKRAIENTIRTVTVKGEVSGWRPNPSGHFYFTLKDAESILPCALFKTSAARLKFRPADGMMVVASGSIELYVPHGKYQLIVDRLEPEGLGALMLQFEQLKERLAKEGLFDEKRKRPIPRFPTTIAIVTSPSGAALQDMLRIITSRWPKAHVVVYPVRVQGDGSALEIAAAIGHLNLARPDVDVMIVGRGGGSIEDLWAFNEEPVARAIFKSRIPIVSAVGHETDFTIADFVADLRAATPTDAATKVVPLWSDVERGLADLASRLDRGVRGDIDAARKNLESLARSAALRSPAWLLRQHLQTLDDFEARLTASLRSTASQARLRLDQHAPRAQLSLNRRLADARQRIEALRAHLEAVSPLAVLQRGYSVTLAGGRVVTDPAQVKPGDVVQTKVAKGSFKSKVE